MEYLFSILPWVAAIVSLFSVIVVIMSVRKTLKKVEADCGHKTKLVDKISAFGCSVKTRIKPKEGKVEYCHKCLQDMAIQCAWCDGVIFIGDPITLYSPKNKDYVPIKNAVIYKKDPLTLVGCLGWNCAYTGADRAGFWMPPGKVKRVATAFEVIMGQVEKGEESPGVSIPDLTKP